MCYSTLHTAMSVMELLVSDQRTAPYFLTSALSCVTTGDHSRYPGVAWPRESSQPKLFPEATNQFQVGSRRAEQVQQPRPRHQLTSYPGRCGGAARPATGWCGAARGRQLRQVRGPERTQCSAQ